MCDCRKQEYGGYYLFYIATTTVYYMYNVAQLYDHAYYTLLLYYYVYQLPNEGKFGMVLLIHMVCVCIVCVCVCACFNDR